jgi:hypothetical protein
VRATCVPRRVVRHRSRSPERRPVLHQSRTPVPEPPGAEPCCDVADQAPPGLSARDLPLAGTVSAANDLARTGLTA